ncbi:ExbD/TolR family protein [Roseibacillus ishigakijimensis]|uniref:Biopolymer transporter ExbD n=1 Tax=Roseibacillus ishigakijimensis TaxID=454146 RepID=A0A934RP63_9BACT|nr:biopolymer transporter ExbD [Roseibacillus ishigakijimensis]MBK1832569.1 biopolymer transporter ExbD [Roseibacillus ishigakijimensis]
MARHKKAQGLEEDEPELNISSLIDICFLLLIYFLVTTTIVRSETDTNMQLPAALRRDEIPPVKPSFIRVDSEGVIYFNTGPAQERLDDDPNSRELPLLSERLSIAAMGARAAGEEPLVQVYVDPEAMHQRAIDVIDTLRKHEITKVTFTDLVP